MSGSPDVDSFDTAMDNSGDRDMTMTVGDSGPNFDDFDRIEGARDEYKESKKVDKKDTKDSKPKGNAKKAESPKGQEVDAEDLQNTEEHRYEQQETNRAAESKKVKMIKAMLNEEAMELHPDTVIPMKIDGEVQNLTVAELRDHFSGKVSWDKRFSELDSERNQYHGEREELVNHLTKVREQVDSVLQEDFEGNPLQGFNYLLDLMGVNTNNFNKRVLEHNLSELEKIQDMDENEQRAYFAEQERDYLRERQGSLESQRQEEQADREFQTEVDELREAHGVDEGSFVKSYDELEGLGYENITPEQVIKYVKTVPHVTRATELLGQVSPDVLQNREVSDKIISSIAEITLEHPDTTDSEIIEELKAQLGVNKDVEVLNRKAAERLPSADNSSKGGTLPKGKHYESFGDYDDEFYGY